MRKSKFTESQIVGMLKEAEAGVPVPDLLRRHGVSRASFFLWRRKYAGASVADRQASQPARGGAIVNRPTLVAGGRHAQRRPA